VRLGEGILNEGYAGGGIVSDAIVPELTEKEKWKYIYFDWKKLFDNVFGEEMAMRRATEKLVSQEAMLLGNELRPFLCSSWNILPYMVLC
jgi:hypothetical protein